MYFPGLIFVDEVTAVGESCIASPVLHRRIVRAAESRRVADRKLQLRTVEVTLFWCPHEWQARQAFE